MSRAPRQATSHEPESRYAWFRLVISVLLGTIGTIGTWSYVLVLPAVQADFDVDRATASMPYTFSMLGFAFGNIVAGRAVDRFGMMPSALASATALGLGFVGASWTQSIWEFSIVHGLLIGIGTGAMFGPLMANLSHWFRRNRGVAVAAAACGNYFAGIALPLVVGDSIEIDGWRPIYFAIGIVTFIVMVPLALLTRREGPREDHVDRASGLTGAERLRSAAFTLRKMQTLLAIAGVSCCVAMSMPQVHIVAYCVDLGYGIARGGEMLVLMLVGGIFSRLGSGWLADRIGGVRTLLIGSVGQCIALFLYLPFDGLMSLYVVSLVFGLAQGGIVPCPPFIVPEYLPAAEAGRRVGLVIVATISGMAFGGWLSGWIYDLTTSYQAAFLNGIAWNLVNISIMAVILWRTGGRRTVAVPA